MANDVRILMGSESDIKNASVILKELSALGVTCGAAIVSCHRHSGGKFEDFVKEMEEKVIVFVGGMSLAAVGLIEALKKNAGQVDYIVFGVPTDLAARSAIEDLPAGTGIITSGLNTVSLNHSLKNSALAVFKIVMLIANEKRKAELAMKWDEWWEKEAKEKPFKPEIELDEKGLIPDNKK